MSQEMSIARTILEQRTSENLTQDEFGARYEVSGPAVFKFEKGYVRPSLGLWMRMAEDAGLTDRRAVLTWLREKMPKQHRHHLEIGAKASPKKSKSGPVNYRSMTERADLRAAIEGDKKLPKAFREVLLDEEIWSTFKPVGAELQIVMDSFSSLGKGSKQAYREALRLIREITHSF